MKYRINIKIDEKKNLANSSAELLAFIVENDKNGDKVNEISNKLNILLTPTQKKILIDEGNLTVLKPVNKPEIINLIYVKRDRKFRNDFFRNNLAKYIAERNSIYNELFIALPNYQDFTNFFESESYFYQTFIEGIYYGNYEFDKYKSEAREKKPLNLILGADESSLSNKVLAKIIESTTHLMDALDFARDLQNEPANVITPETFCLAVKSKCSHANIKVTVWDENDLKRKKLNGILAVGGGSINSPRLLKMQYSPKSVNSKHIVIVGKGITFDTGGISIKPAADMWEMKGDMAGASIAASILVAAERINLPIKLTALIPLAENMPSGSAFRPGDIITTASGKTVEIDNTDAEGRIILADALHLATIEKPDLIIDIATLTGAITVALGLYAAGIFSTNEDYAKQLYTSGIKTYEYVWQMPLWDEYDKLIKSEVADLTNLSGRLGGAIKAAKFLQHFVDENIPWIHVDIAGPSSPHDLTNYTKKYMTGYGHRLLVDFLSQIS